MTSDRYQVTGLKHKGTCTLLKGSRPGPKRRNKPHGWGGSKLPAGLHTIKNTALERTTAQTLGETSVQITCEL